MFNITDSFASAIKKDNVEIFWYRENFKVILFVNEVPVSFINLEDDENNIMDVQNAAVKLIKGQGTTL